MSRVSIVLCCIAKKNRKEKKKNCTVLNFLAKYEEENIFLRVFFNRFISTSVNIRTCSRFDWTVTSQVQVRRRLWQGRSSTTPWKRRRCQQRRRRRHRGRSARRHDRRRPSREDSAVARWNLFSAAFARWFCPIFSLPRMKWFCDAGRNRPTLKF